MANPWFRQHSKFAHDPKVQMMPEAMQRRLVMLNCMRCSNTLETLQEQEIAFQLRIDVTALAETKALFIEKGFVDENWNLLLWDEEQYASDSSTERVRQHRERQRQAALASETEKERFSNGLDTEQNRTEAEQKRQASTAGAVPPGPETGKRAEHGKGAPELDRGKVLDTLPLNDKTSYELREDDLAMDQELYPGVDVLAEYREMRAYFRAEPTKLKTRKGIRKFIHYTLSKAQDKAGLSRTHGGSNASTHGSTGNGAGAVGERRVVSHDAIRAAVERRQSGHAGDADGGDAGTVCGTGAAAGDSGHVPGGVGGTGAAVRDAGVQGRVVEGHTG